MKQAAGPGLAELTGLSAITIHDMTPAGLFTPSINLDLALPRRPSSVFLRDQRPAHQLKAAFRHLCKIPILRHR